MKKKKSIKKRSVNSQSIKYLQNLARTSIQGQLKQGKKPNLINAVSEVLNVADLKKLGVDNATDWVPTDSITELQKENLSQVIEDVRSNINESKLDDTQIIDLYYVNVYEACVELSNWELIAKDNTITIIKCYKANDNPIPIEISQQDFSSIHVNQATTLKNISTQTLTLFEEATIELPNLNESNTGIIRLPNKLLILDFVEKDGTEAKNYLFNDRVFVIQNSSFVSPNNLKKDRRINLTFNSWNMVRIDKNINSIVAKDDHPIFQEQQYRHLALACKGHTLLNYGGCQVEFISGGVSQPSDLLFDWLTEEDKTNNVKIHDNSVFDIIISAEKFTVNNYHINPLRRGADTLLRDIDNLYGGMEGEMTLSYPGVALSIDWHWGNWDSISTTPDIENIPTEAPFALYYDFPATRHLIQGLEEELQPETLDWILGSEFSFDLRIVNFIIINPHNTENTTIQNSFDDTHEDNNVNQRFYEEGLRIFGTEANNHDFNPFILVIDSITSSSDTELQLRGHIDFRKTLLNIHQNGNGGHWLRSYFNTTFADNGFGNYRILEVREPFEDPTKLHYAFHSQIPTRANQLDNTNEIYIDLTFNISKVNTLLNKRRSLELKKIVFPPSVDPNNPNKIFRNVNHSLFQIPDDEATSWAELLNGTTILKIKYVVSNLTLLNREKELPTLTYTVKTKIEDYSIVPVNIFFKSETSQSAIALDIYCYCIHFDKVYNDWNETGGRTLNRYYGWHNVNLATGNVSLTWGRYNEHLNELVFAIYFSYIFNNAYDYTSLDLGKALWRWGATETGDKNDFKGDGPVDKSAHLPRSCSYAFIETIKQAVGKIGKPEQVLSVWFLRGNLFPRNDVEALHSSKEVYVYGKKYDGVTHTIHDTNFNLTYFNALNEDILWEKLPNNGNVPTNGLYSIFSSFISQIKFQPTFVLGGSDQVANYGIPGLGALPVDWSNHNLYQAYFQHQPLISTADYSDGGDKGIAGQKIYPDVGFNENTAWRAGVFRLVNNLSAKGQFPQAIAFAPFANIQMSDVGMGKLDTTGWTIDSYFYTDLIRIPDGFFEKPSRLVINPLIKNMSINQIHPIIRFNNIVHINPSPNPLRDNLTIHQKNEYEIKDVDNLYLFPKGNLAEYPDSPYFNAQQLDKFFQYQTLCYYFTFTQTPLTPYPDDTVDTFKLRRLTLRGLYGSSGCSFVFLDSTNNIIFDFEDLTSDNIDLFDEFNNLTSLTEFIVLDCNE